MKQRYENYHSNGEKLLVAYRDVKNDSHERENHVTAYLMNITTTTRVFALRLINRKLVLFDTHVPV